MLVVAAGSLAGARAVTDVPALVLFVVGFATLAAWPAVRLVSLRRAGRLDAAAANRGLLLATILPSVLAVLIAAAVLRAPGARAGSHEVEDIGFDPVVGHSPRLTDDDVARGVVLERTVGERKHVPDPSRDQAILLGDSVLFGWGLPDDQTAARLLEPRLPGLQVLNASVSGYSPEQYLLYLDEILRRPGVRPRVVVVGPYAGNDYHSCATSDWRGHSKPLFHLRDGRLVNSRPVLPAWNCVDVLGGSLLMHPFWRFKEAAERVVDAICGNDTIAEPELEGVFRALFRAIDARTREAGARLVVVLFPDRNDLDTRDTEYRRALSRHDRMLRLLREEGLDTIAFADALREASPDPTPRFLENDAAHYSPDGQRLLADVLERALRTRLGLPEPGTPRD